MHIPIVPPAAFRSLIGDVLVTELNELLARKEGAEIVLFSDVAGGELALLTVGPGKRFERLADVGEVEIDGLRALCALRVGDADAAGAEGAGATGGEAVSDAQARKELTQMEESLNARERYIAECEHRIAEVGQNLSEREAMLEQREQQLLSKERDFFRRGGDAARQADGAAPDA